ncbi:MAG: hypothetical protein NVS4B8_24360 [Herpetosiphon sp.]
MKIQQHPRMRDVRIGDDVLCYGSQLYARVEEIFPAAVCVRLVAFRTTARGLRLVVSPLLWCADQIENLSVCRYCGGRTALQIESTSGIPFRMCATCRSVRDACEIGAITGNIPS